MDAAEEQHRKRAKVEGGGEKEEDGPPPEEAQRIAEIAARAEARAAARAAAAAGGGGNGGGGGGGGGNHKLPPLPTLINGGPPKVEFLTKKQREQLALQKLQEKRAAATSGSKPSLPSSSSSLSASSSSSGFARSSSSGSMRPPAPPSRDGGGGGGGGGGRDYRDNSSSRDRERSRDRDGGRDGGRDWSRDRGGGGGGGGGRDVRDYRGGRGGGGGGGGGGMSKEEREKERLERQRQEELQALKDHYLGKKEVKKRVHKPSEKFARIFQFDWEPSEDTSKDSNPLYNQRLEVTPLFGRGYVAGVDMREQRKTNRYLEALTLKRQEEERRAEETMGVSRGDRRSKEEERQSLVEDMRRRREVEARGMEKATIGVLGKHWRDKPLEKMTERDWRIFREDFDISMRVGTQKVLPLRNWEEAHLPAALLKTIEGMGWVEPSPIQRAAIPVGLGRRDIIGIAETGSGKTGAFAIPMINYCLTLPAEHRKRTPEEGPLALVMAPTRELAEQIETQVAILIEGTGLKSCSGVGGKPIEDQAFALRQGVDILIGTPGRLKDLIDSRYLVLNQCNYIVLDEADRMVDMGFEEQVVAVLDMMGGLLKSENEEEADRQAEAAQRGEQLYRVTAMFSATMPVAVERIARSYLRAPATIKIGDANSGKNKRIEQRVVFTTEPGKRKNVVDLLANPKKEDKFIVFVNAKRACDVLARQLEQAHISCGILHGGKSQDQREASLEAFRAGSFTVLVATDVAARGLDIPDVSHIINYDMPAKIENYCHRIGRTGRAGKEGLATTLLTENDSEVFHDLKSYLESTDMKVPPELARHAAAQQAPGTRNEDGKIMGQKRDSVMYSKR